MRQKSILTVALLLIGAFLIACTAQVAPAEDPAAAAAVMEEMVEEEGHDDDDGEDHSDEAEDHDDDAMDDDAMMEEKEEETEMAMADASEAVYAINTADSTVAWRGAKAVGSGHTGTIDVAEGSLTVADGQLISGSFVIDMTTMVSTDGANSRLIGHLESDDFFGIETHPTASLVINSAEAQGGDQYVVSGDLTIKGITNPIEFTATAAEADGQLSATADIVFDRALYDVQYASGSFFDGLGNDLINDEIEITVELIATK